MGCCGHSFGTKEEIKKAIADNCLEFEERDPKTEKELIGFRDRALPMDLREGVCRNLIEKEGKLFCPLHPGQNKGKDLRKGHCDFNYMCLTAKEFSGWVEAKQGQFLNFVRKKKLDKIDYSLKIENGSLLEEFKSFTKIKEKLY